MKISAVSMKSYPSRANQNASGVNRTVSKPLNPSFGLTVYNVPFETQKLKTIWRDGPELFQLAENTYPKLKEKFQKFFDINMHFHLDMERTIKVQASTKTEKWGELIDFIAQKNKTEFKFPQQVISDLQNERNLGWLNYEYFYPLSLKYEKLEYDETSRRLLEFAKNENEVSLIKKLYQECPPYNDSTGGVPGTYWANPGW